MRFLPFLLAAAPAFCTPLVCNVTLFPDEQPIDLSCPQIGSTINPLPGSSWFVSLEDLPLWVGSKDFNDNAELVSFTASQAQFSYISHDSQLYSEFLVDGLPVFSTLSVPGTTATAALANLSIGFRVTYPGFAPVTYAVGSPNVYVACISGCAPVNAVPEASSRVTLGIGLFLLAGLYRLGDIVHRWQHRRS